VSISGNTISITEDTAANVASSATFNVVAEQSGVTASKAITLIKPESVIQSLSVNASQESINVPAKGEGTKTVTVSATGIDQYGTSSAAAPDWSLQNAPIGVSIEGDTISITEDTAANVKDIMAFDVVGTINGVSASKTITLIPAPVEEKNGIDQITKDGNTVSATYSITGESTITAIAALFDGNTLIEIVTHPDVATGKTTQTFNFNNDIQGKTIRLFAFNNLSDIKPRCESQNVN